MTPPSQPAAALASPLASRLASPLASVVAGPGAPADAASASARLCQLNYRPDLSQAQLFREHAAWAERFASPMAPAATHPNPPEPERPLRVGYVSGDFRRHPVAFFVEPLLRCHDRRVVQPFCYSNSGERDDLNDHLRALVPDWRDIAGLDDDAVAALIRRDRIDVLVDLSGHTARNRLPVFARKPAPVQVTAIGYVNTTGLAAMDYRLTDGWCDPPGTDETHFSESLWRLPGGFNCYAPPNGLPAPGPAPLMGCGHVTFGSFNNMDKVSPEVLDLWAQLLRAVPGARLVLKTKTLSESAVGAAIRARFAAAGVDAGRIELIEWSATLREHFEHYRRIDIALDPFPYNGTTTTCEALMMGVPVIALAGERHAARVSASILARLGLEVLVAPDPAGYLARAQALALKPEAVANLRAGLRRRIAASPLADAAGYTRGLEAAYREMWRRWCATAGVSSPP